MRIVEIVTLMDPDTGATVIERRYTQDSGIANTVPIVDAVEYWSVLAMGISQNGRQVGVKQVPFKIDAANRVQAFTNLPASMVAASEVAKKQMAEEMEQARKREASRILLAPAVGNAAPNGRRLQ